VFGGSFNPPHLGHLVLASEISDQLDLDRVLFVPAARPPHKVVDDDTPAAVRLEMTAAAVADDERFLVSPIEIEQDLSYTLDSVAAVHRRHDQVELFFLMGSDSLLQFETWHEPTQLLTLCTLAVGLRPGDDERAVEDVAARYGRRRVRVLGTTQIGIASRAVRNRVRMGMPIRYLVPDAVERYIREHGLYLTKQ
jgi:nicotinate-nucleotide adenylyltransferase